MDTNYELTELIEITMEEGVNLELDDHPTSILRSLHKMKKSEVMTDVTLMLPDESAIPCHKVVLMAASPFFETMFQSGLMDCTEQDVHVDFADADTIRTLVDFFYTGVIKVTDENVKELIAASEFLCCKDLKTNLEEYIDDNVESSNCIQLYKLSTLYNLSTLLVTAFQFILINFQEFASMTDFETLTEEELLDIVSNDGLNVKNEDIVFDAVIHWVDADPDLRKEAFSRIAPLIRFPFCTLAMLTEDICRNRLVISSGCIELALEALGSPYHFSSHHAIHNARCVPRRAFKGVRKQRLIRMIESDTFNRIDCSVTTPESGQFMEWENILPDIQSTLKTFAVSSTGIYWVNGHRALHFLDAKTKKVLSTCAWEPANETSAIADIDNKITAFGGYKPGTCTPLKSVESLNTEATNPEWKPEPEMLHALLEPYVVRFANKVYVFGGEDGDGPSRVTQEFDPLRGKWRVRSEMPGLCTFGSAVAFNDKIYVVGGVEQVCYSYKPSKDVWKVLSQPAEVYNRFTTATTWNGNILLGNSEYVEEYNPTEDTWSVQNQVLPEDHPDTHRMVLHTVWF